MVKIKNTKSGFTLVELSIVLSIVAVFLGMMIITTKARIDEAKIFLTKERIQLIMDAMDRHVRTYGYIPCPSDITLVRSDPNYGAGAGSNTATGAIGGCSGAQVLVGAGDNRNSVVRGGVPFQALGLDADVAVDAWGKRFDYVTAQGYTAFASYQADFKTTTYGNIRMFTDGSAITQTRDTDIAYVLVSHGPNGFYGVDDVTGARMSIATITMSVEVMNGDVNRDFVSLPPSSSFDDIIVYRSRWQLSRYLQ